MKDHPTPARLMEEISMKTHLIHDALHLLGPSAPRALNIRLDAALPQAARTRDGLIHLNPTSPQFLAAERGDLVPLALLLAGELLAGEKTS
jgi:hypothetical protein